ncbi:MAG: hypothetical protein VYB50_05845 [Candidatus Thermoplasmatota archaeon]|nr:hypothetical protein [Euryarchaeota archaeon]MED5350995.1 hypothetical protein [Candidatus Thermoplasmatota archaeon]
MVVGQMDALTFTWATRDLGEPISALFISSDKEIIAGGWNGNMKCWGEDGSLLWSIQLSDRIASILQLNESYIATDGMHVSCIKEGKMVWSQPLEGSADLLAIGDETIIATSSVYDIEHGDFMESAIWTFTEQGEMIDVFRLDERPWHLHYGDGMMIGLGRPKCGIFVDGNFENLSSDSPVVCGVSNGGDCFFGHADGTISTKDAQVFKHENSIKSLCLGELLVFSDEDGFLGALDKKTYELSWKEHGKIIHTHAIGFSSTHWCHRGDGVDQKIEIRNNKGEMIHSQQLSRVNTFSSKGELMAAGLETGIIHMWEERMFFRGLERKNELKRDNRLDAKLLSLREKFSENNK